MQEPQHQGVRTTKLVAPALRNADQLLRGLDDVREIGRYRTVVSLMQVGRRRAIDQEAERFLATIVAARIHHPLALVDLAGIEIGNHLAFTGTQRLAKKWAGAGERFANLQGVSGWKRGDVNATSLLGCGEDYRRRDKLLRLLGRDV